MANTPATARAPFAGVLRAVVADGDAALRPIDYRIMTKEALAGPVEEVPGHEAFPPVLIARPGLRILLWRLRGHHRRTSFFDPETGAPIADPSR